MLTPLEDEDRLLLKRYLSDWLPSEIYDIHTHGFHSSHFSGKVWPFVEQLGEAGCQSHREHLLASMPGVETIHGLYFGLPTRHGDCPAINDWMANEVATHGTADSRALIIARPDDSQQTIAEALRSGRFSGIKVYHCFANRPDTFNATLEEYAPDWMWEILNETNGVLMLHIVRDAAIADEANQRSLRRLCRSYPKVKLVLAHVSRSFNYRNARCGMAAIADLENAYIDTSAICEAEAFRAAIKVLGPRRILWGSDFPISELRGRCVSIGESFFWLHPETIQSGDAPTTNRMTLVGIESLLSLREATEDAGWTQSDLNDLFLNNARRLLQLQGES